MELKNAELVYRALELPDTDSSYPNKDEVDRIKLFEPKPMVSKGKSIGLGIGNHPMNPDS